MTVAELKAMLDEHDDDKQVFTIADNGQYIPLDVYFSDEEVYTGRDVSDLVDGVVMY